MNTKDRIRKKRRQRKISLCLLICVFVLSFSPLCFAALPCSGSNSSDNIISYYSGVQGNGYTYLQSDIIKTYLTGLGVNTDATNGFFDNMRFGAGSSNVQAVYEQYYHFPITVSYNNHNMSFNLNAPRVWTYFNLSGYDYYYSYAFTGGGRFALLNYQNRCYVVSDATFDIGLYYDGDMSGFGVPNAGYTATSLASGYYYYDFGEVYGGEYVNFTNLPVYVCSVDGSTGCTTLGDFAFNSNLVNCNYLFIGGQFTDPDAPVVDPDDTINYSQDGSHYNFGSVDLQFLSGEMPYIPIQYSFNLNTYMLSHLEEYTFHHEYKITVTSNYGDNVFTTSYDTPVGGILLHGDQLYNVTLQTSQFIDSNSLSFDTFLRNVWNSATNGLSSYYTNNSVLSYGKTDPSQTRSFGKFTLGVNENFASDFSTLKIYYKCYFVWHGAQDVQSGKLSGWKSLLSNRSNTTENTISNNLNPPSTDLVNNYPANYGDGGVAYSSPASVNVVVNNNSGQGWTPFTLGQVDYANVKSMFDDIKEFVDSTSENSFWNVLITVLKPAEQGGYIPSKIWEYITISIAVICGFAVVRYVLRR